MLNFNEKNIIDYCCNHSQKKSTILQNIESFTLANENIPQMISGQIVVNFLKSVIKMINAKKIVEVGTFTGFSAVAMAESLPPDGELHTCELMNKHVQTAQSFFNKSNNIKNKIFIHAGSAIQSLEQLPSNSFDMAFIDADKINYLTYYKQCLKLVKKGGIIIYMVCSFFDSEGLYQINHFIKNNKNFKTVKFDNKRLKIAKKIINKKGFLYTIQTRLENKIFIDGFFAAKLIKND